MRRFLICTTALAIGLAGTAQAQREGFHKLVREYFDAFWLRSPTSATSAGLHDWDTKLDDVSAPAHARERHG